MAELGWYDKALECMDHEDYAQAKEYPFGCLLRNNHRY